MNNAITSVWLHRMQRRIHCITRCLVPSCECISSGCHRVDITGWLSSFLPMDSLSTSLQTIYWVNIEPTTLRHVFMLLETHESCLGTHCPIIHEMQTAWSVGDTRSASRAPPSKVALTRSGPCISAQSCRQILFGALNTTLIKQWPDPEPKGQQSSQIAQGIESLDTALGETPTHFAPDNQVSVIT